MVAQLCAHTKAPELCALKGQSTRNAGDASKTACDQSEQAPAVWPAIGGAPGSQRPPRWRFRGLPRGLGTGRGFLARTPVRVEPKLKGSDLEGQMR